MTRKPATRDDPEESKRFIKAAEELDSPLTDEQFERAFKKVAPPKRIKPAPRGKP